MIHALNEEAYGFIFSCVTAVTLVVQLYVFFLVQFQSPELMSEYRYFLNLITIWDMLFTIALDTVSPNPIQDAFAVSTTGWRKNLSPKSQLFLMGICFYAGGTVVSAQIYCLIYRFTVIQIDKRLHRIFMSTPIKIFWFVAQQTMCIFLGVLTYFACVQPEEFFARAHQEESLEIRTIITSEHPFFMWFDTSRSLAPWWFLGTLTSYFIIAETVFVFLIYFILKTLNRNSSSFTEATQKLHRQFTILLAVQVASPTLFIWTPATGFIITATIFKTYPYQLTSQLGFIFMSLYPISNALFTILYIAPYREHFFQLLVRLKLRKMSARRLGISRRTENITRVIPRAQTIGPGTYTQYRY